MFSSNGDSEINLMKHFIKIHFVKKGIEFINLLSMFKDKSITSSIPTYFENEEPPFIYKKYNKGTEWGKDQESIQSRTIPDPGYHKG